jgi:hypothetical protein
LFEADQIGAAMARLTIIVNRATARRRIAVQLRVGDEVIVACTEDRNYDDGAIDRCQARADGDEDVIRT